MTDEQFVLNPQTGRAVKIGGRIWHRLLKKNLIKNDTNYKDPNILATIGEEDNVKVKITEINQSLPPEIEAVTGRGKYKNKIVKRQLPVSRKPKVEIQQAVSSDSDTDSDDDIKDMILNELRKSTIQSKRKSKQYTTTDTEYTTEPEYTTDYQTTDVE